MSSATEGEPEPEEQDDDAGEESTWLKLRTPGSEFDESELNDALYWIRQALAVVFGLAYGLTPVTGAVGNISFFIISTIGVHMYLVNFIGIEDQDYGGFAQVAQEGFPPAFATFTLWWMITYSLSHAAPVS